MIDIGWHIANLPDPEKDTMPPYVGMSLEEAEQAEKDRRLVRSLLDTKRHTEAYAKRILEGAIFKGHFNKDGDWITRVGGQRVWQKKTADFVGGVPLLSKPNAHTYVEVKGVSPGKSFSFGRLDKRNNPRQPSQHEKLTREMNRGNLVWLFIGWWNSCKEPTKIKQGGREIAKWRLEDVELVVTLFQWQDWLEFYGQHKYRSIRQKDRLLLNRFRITKEGNRWVLDKGHWWHELI